MTTVEQDLELKDIYAKSREADYTPAGTLEDLAGGLEFSGGVSLKTRMESGEVMTEQLEKAKEIAMECYVPISRGAIIRCGDDRPSIALDKLMAMDIRDLAVLDLGPQAMGAVQSYATALRAVQTPFGKATLLGDIKTVKAPLASAGVGVGMHTDAACQQKTDGSIGCGAVMHLKNGARAYGSEKDSGLSTLASNIVGGEYKQSMHDEHVRNMAELPETYIGNPADVLEGFIKEEGADACELVHDQHLAGLVLVNSVKDTVFNRDLYIRRCLDEIGVRIDAFNVDVWLAPIVAQKLFDGDPSAQESYVTAWADWQARPAAFITDGSQHVLVRSEKLAASA